MLAMELCWLDLAVILAWDHLGGSPASPVWLLAIIALSGLVAGRTRLAPTLQRTRLELVVPLLLAIVSIRFLSYPSLSIGDFSWTESVALDMYNVFDGVSPSLLVLVATGVLWWRGRTIVDADLTQRLIGLRFQYGLVLLLTVILLSGGSRPVEMTIAVLTYFTAGLASLSLLRATDGRQVASGGWGSLALGLAIAAGGLSLFVATVILGDLLRALITATNTVIEIGSAFARWVAALIYGGWLVPASEPTRPASPFQPPVGALGPDSLLPPWLELIIGIIVMIGIFWGLLVAVNHVARHIQLHYGGGAPLGDAGEKMAASARQDLHLWLARVRRWLQNLFRFRRRQALLDTVANERSGSIESAETVEVRRIYAALLRLAAEQGHRRRPAETPREYLPALQTVLRSAANECEALTALYESVRYAGQEPTDQDLLDARAWHEAARAAAGELQLR